MNAVSVMSHILQFENALLDIQYCFFSLKVPAKERMISVKYFYLKNMEFLR